MNRISVTTTTGILTGLNDDRGVSIFKGIPYAEQPVGKKRWLVPQPLKRSGNEIECFEYGNTAVQSIDEVEEASLSPQGEDCLTLNIWVKEPQRIAARPVMVFIHGGSYMAGGTTDPLYDGYRFALDNDVLFVTINYRLNVLGFVSFEEIGGPDYKESGYLGLMDQVTALEWIKENIGAFGGDPGNITIFGESCGGGSVSLLMTVPRAKGLFNKVIAQSGSLILRKSADMARKIGWDFLRKMNCVNMSDLLTLDTAQIRAGADEFQFDYGYKYGIMFAPETNNPFIPRDPFNSLLSGTSKDIKLMIGTNANEFNYWKFYFDDFDHAMPAFLSDQLFIMGLVLHHQDEVFNDFIEYRKKSGLQENNIAFADEALFRIPAIKMAEIQSEFNDTYMYYFTWPSNVPGLKSCHALELPFVFNTMENKGSRQFTGEDAPNSLSEAMQKTWVAFAATGNPNNAAIPQWDKYDKQKRATMVINQKWRQEEDPESELRKICAKLYNY